VSRSVSFRLFHSTLIAGWFSLLLIPALVKGQDAAKGNDGSPTWADKMMSGRSVDFGTVARGADLSQTIRISNLYKETVTIAEVTVASPDFEASVDKREIASRETSILTIRPRTNEISDTSSSTVILKLTFDGTNYKTVQVSVSARVSTTETAAATSISPTTKVMKPGLNWAEQMFSELKYDFGNVARGAETKHVIEIVNLYKEDVTLTTPVASCRCITPYLDRTHLKSKEVARLTLNLDTIAFKDKRDVTLTMSATFDGLNSKPIRIPIQAYIRRDVVLEPGSVHFGTAAPGETAERRVRVIYAGRGDWTIRSVRSNSSHLTSELKEVSRYGQNVEYELLVKLSGTAPKGSLKDQLVLVTDDLANPNIPVLVDATIENDLKVVPEDVKFGTVKVGTPKMTQFVVQGRKPFRIEKVECDSDRDWFSVALTPLDKTTHVVQITMTAPDQPGEFRENMTVTVAGRKLPLSFTASGIIEAAAPVAAPMSESTESAAPVSEAPASEPAPQTPDTPVTNP
jgi:hypothetical protein